MGHYEKRKCQSNNDLLSLNESETSLHCPIPRTIIIKSFIKPESLDTNKLSGLTKRVFRKPMNETTYDFRSFNSKSGSFSNKKLPKHKSKSMNDLRKYDSSKISLLKP